MSLLSINNNTINTVEIMPATQAYEKINLFELHQLQKDFNWLTVPLFRASHHVQKMPFFKWVANIESSKEFGDCAKQLYYHSATFPKVISLMLGMTPHQENSMMPFYAEHIFGEADHHELLMRWMLRQNILKQRHEIQNILVTQETNACVNLAYQLAFERNRDNWLVAMNCGIERCSNDFFSMIAPKMHKLGAGDIYFDVHVEADKHHSIMGLKYLSQQNYTLQEREYLIAKGLEGISLWASMLHSWIGINTKPWFDLEGNVIS